MAMYVYATDGRPVGFRFGNFVHDMDGSPLGRILGTHVYRFDGSYVAELYKDSVVAKPVFSPKQIAPTPSPPMAEPPAPGNPRRGVVDYGYADMFDALRTTAAADDEAA